MYLESASADMAMLVLCVMLVSPIPIPHTSILHNKRLCSMHSIHSLTTLPFPYLYSHVSRLDSMSEGDPLLQQWYL